jgi:DNA-binding beta-propeller fold protein YncE
MHLRHLFSSRLRGSLLLGSLLVASSFSTQAAEEMLRKAVGKGAYEMAYSQQENALWLATSQSRKLDKGGVVYRLDPVTLEVTQAIHNDLKPFGATINNTTQTLWFGNTVNSAVTAIDAKTGEVKGRLVLDDRKRTEEVRPLQPRELVADDATNTVYISGIGKESVIWVVDGENIKLKTAIQNTGKMSTGLALDSKGKRLYTTNADGELITIDTADNKILSRKKLLDDGKEHFFINISLDTARQRAFITDSKAAEVLVVDTRNGNILAKVAAMTDAWNIYLAAGRGFETPTINELSYRADGQSGMNFGLKPSTNDTIEIGSKTRIGDGLLSLALFQTDTDDEIVVDSSSGGRTTYKNAGKTRRQGAELAWDQRFAGDFRVNASWTWLDATYHSNVCNEQDCNGNRMPGIARNMGFASIGYVPEDGWYAGTEARYMGDIMADDENTAKAPSYTLVGLFTGYKYNYHNLTVDLFGRVDNLFDKEYVGSVIVNESNGRYYEPSPGRNYGVGMNIAWRFE